VNAIVFAKISGGAMPSLPVPGCGPALEHAAFAVMTSVFATQGKYLSQTLLSAI